jgi:hypothetical protein
MTLEDQRRTQTHKWPRSRAWTCGLAAAGLIGLPVSRGTAEEQLSSVWTALSSTTIRGYVNTSMHWNTGTGNGVVPAVLYNTPDKQDGFNLNVVDLEIEKPLDETAWAAGYKAQLWFGQDAAIFGSNNSISKGANREDFAIRQAYAALRTPVGNGLDFKVGVFDPVVGYESHDSGRNPNYTRSYATSLEPFDHTGVLMSYQFTSLISASAGVANTVGPIINQRANPPKSESFKTYMGSVTLSAPEDWGFLAGSTLYAGVVNGYSNNRNWDQTLWFSGVTLNTPIKALRVGISYDYLGTTDDFAGENYYANALALYASLQISTKLSVHGRAEYAWTDTTWLGSAADLSGGNSKVFALTGTLQYDLWRNVLSRIEVRWDHQTGDGDMTGFGDEVGGFGGGGFGGLAAPPPPEGSRRNNFLIAANIIYLF